MTTDEALTKLAQSTAQAIPQTLATYGVEQVEIGEPVVSEDVSAPFAGLPFPGVVTSVQYEGGAAGGNVIGLSVRGARLLAAAMMGQGPGAVGEEETELSELEASAVAEAMNQVMAAAAGAVGAVLETSVEIRPPDMRTLAGEAEAIAAFASTAAYVVTTDLTLLGEPCHLVLLVPNAFVVRMTRALDELESEVRREVPVSLAAAGDESLAIGGALKSTRLRVWAEIGRAKLPVGKVVGLPAGAVLELDRLADDPVDIFVNGHRYALGRLVVEEDGEWAVRLEQILPRSAPTPQEVS